ncbi:MAG: hypothetical protein GY822_09760 [Deltaproteobacteria bacterium]|nr:hypothetical protein [Deltaproteobacteria bacterium]
MTVQTPCAASVLIEEARHTTTLADQEALIANTTTEVATAVVVPLAVCSSLPAPSSMMRLSPRSPQMPLLSEHELWRGWLWPKGRLYRGAHFRRHAQGFVKTSCAETKANTEQELTLSNAPEGFS